METDSPRLRAWQAITALVAWLVGQVGCSGAVFFFVLVLAVATRMPRSEASGAALQLAPASALIGAACGAVLLFVTVWLCLGSGAGRALRGLGVVPPRAALAGAGLAAGGVLGGLAVLLSPWGSAPSAGALATVASLSVAGFACWALLAVVLVPLVEEFLFRGVLLQGLSGGLGVAGAAVTASLLFLGLHAADVWGSWTGALLLLLLAAATMGARLASGSLLPPLACHAAYNLVLAVFLGLALQAGTPNPFAPAGQVAWIAMIVGDSEVAEREFARQAEQEPENADVHYRRGGALNRLGRKEEALREYDLAARLRPDDAATRNNRGYVLAELGYFEEALGECDASLALEPDSAATRDSRAYTLVGLGRYEEAVEEYERTLRLAPDKAHAWFGLGEALERLGQDEDAQEAFDRARELDPDLRLTWRAARRRR